jgi:predicted component of type VI protein secretion system
VSIDHARVRRESIRWFLLVAANVSRPQGVYVEGMLPVVRAVYADATENEVKRELDYLEDRGLVKIQRDGMDRWFVDLTRHGIDLVEYTTQVEPGIARPQPAGG